MGWVGGWLVGPHFLWPCINLFNPGPSVMADNIATSLGLMRRMPPNKVEQNLTGLLNLLPDNEDELLQRIDQPLREITDTDSVRPNLNIFIDFLPVLLPNT